MADGRTLKELGISGSLRKASTNTAILKALELSEEDRIKPRVLSSQVIKHVDDLQVLLLS